MSISKLRIKDDLPSKLYRIPRQQYTSNIQQYTSSEYNREIRVNRKHQPTNIDAKNFNFHMDSLLSGRKLSRDILALPSRDSIHYSCFSSCKFTLLRPRLHETGRMFIRMKTHPDENSSGLLRLHGSAKKFVHLTFPFTWDLPESIRKAAFRILTAEIVVH